MLSREIGLVIGNRANAAAPRTFVGIGFMRRGRSRGGLAALTQAPRDELLLEPGAKFAVGPRRLEALQEIPGALRLVREVDVGVAFRLGHSPAFTM
jgi:hypothetical protein